MSDINNNAGLIRIDNVIEYRSSTQLAEEFVNARISAAIAGWNKTTGDNIPDEGISLTSRVFTCVHKDPHPVFAPFWLSLPLSALEDGQIRRNKKNQQTNTAGANFVDMINRRDGGNGDVKGSGKIRLRDPYAAIVKQYMFDYNDLENLMHDGKSMREMHLNIEQLREIKKHSVLHIHRFKKNCTRVIVLIDPREVFKDMIVSNNNALADLNNRPFNVVLHPVQQTNTGKWNYTVTCKIFSGKNKNKKKGNFNEDDMINGQLATM